MSDLHERFRALDLDAPVHAPAAWQARAEAAQQQQARRALRRRMLVPALAAGAAAVAVATPNLMPGHHTSTPAPAPAARAIGPGTYPKSRPVPPIAPTGVRLSASPIPRAALLASVINYQDSDLRNAATGERITSAPTSRDVIRGNIVSDTYAYSADGLGWRLLDRLEQGPATGGPPEHAYNSLSDDGMLAAGGSTFSQPATLQVLTLRTAQARTYSLDRYGSVRDIRFAPNDRYLTFTFGLTKPGASASTQELWLLDLVTNRFTKLAANASSAAGWSSDSRRIATVTGRAGVRSDEQPALSVIDINSRRVSRYGDVKLQVGGAPLWSPNDQELWLLGSARTQVLRRVNLGSGAITDVPVVRTALGQNDGVIGRRGRYVILDNGLTVSRLDPGTGGKTRFPAELTYQAVAHGILEHGNLR